MLFIAKILKETPTHLFWSEENLEEYNLYDNIFRSVESEFICRDVVNLLPLLYNEDVEIAAMAAKGK